MEGSPEVTESLVTIDSGTDSVLSGWTPTDDQSFLLFFIFGTYFAPDIKGEKPQKSVWQRLAECLPPYNPEQLAGSCIKTVEVARVYYYILRKADQSVILRLPWLHQFFHGSLSTSTLGAAVTFPQFNDLFPFHLHPHSIFKGQYGVINNIVFINNPETVYIGAEYIQRFKRLTRLEDLHLDRDCARRYTSVDGKVLHSVDVQEVDFQKNLVPRSLSGSQKTMPSSQLPEIEDPLRQAYTVKPVNSVPYNGGPSIGSVPNVSTSLHVTDVTPQTFSNASHFPTEMEGSSVVKFEPDMIFLPARPTREEWINIVSATKGGSALTGSAAKGHIGPVLGLVDIGECADSYLFRVSLPGVKRDEREFCCEVENDGKVSIKGVTVTGEKMVHRFDQIFEMQSRNLCPPGHFSISFKLPGPVDPQQFSGNFGTDGILEGIVMKGQ